MKSKRLELHSQNREVLEHKGEMEVRDDTDKRGEPRRKKESKKR